MLKPVTREAYQLMHDGAIAFARMEARGIQIDMNYLYKTIIENGERIDKLSERLRDHKIFALWKKTFRGKTKLGSREQLAHILFEVIKYPVTIRTPTGQPSGDESHLSTVNIGFIKGYIKYHKLLKMGSTYLANIERENIDGIIHPFFNLHTTVTYRSSSDHPNFQNIPIRDPAIGKIIRRCFRARDNHYLVELDFSGIEVRVAACYHKDPRMMEYINDKSTDMHRDMASQIYMLEADLVTKAIRHAGKNMFVFPQFYGDYYINCAKHMWNEIEKRDFEFNGMYSLYKHLEERGIKKLGACDPEKKSKPGTFEHHMKKVEDDFWNNRFKVYNHWKKKWFNMYQAQGGFNFYTGFRVEGIYKRNDVINYPIQGSAFHCLLWALIQLDKAMRRAKMKSRIIGQIHDSIIADVHKDEKMQYIEMSHKIMTIDLCKHWKWIITPIEIGAEVTPLNGSWDQKKEVEL